MLCRCLSGDSETLTRNAGWLMIATFVCGLLCVKYDLSGILTVVQLGSLSASAAMLVNYRRERGLWMLASLFLVLLIAIYALGVLGKLCDALRGVAPPLAILIDAALATLVLTIHIRFLWNTAWANYACFKMHTD